MNLWLTAVVSVISGAAAASVLPFFTARREQRFKVRVEAVGKFIDLAGRAHARDKDRDVGVSEQVAALEMVAQFGIDYPFLREAARAGLADTVRWSATSSPDLHAAAVKAQARLDLLSRGRFRRWN